MAPGPARGPGRPTPTGSTAIDLTLSPKEMLRLFDLLPDVLFFIKGTQCRYTHVNKTMTQRLGIKRREDILGKSVLELYPPALSTRYILQDRRVLKG